MPAKTLITGIYLFDEMEVLDFSGPFEVFSTASRVGKKLNPDHSHPFSVFTLADTKRTIVARGGLKVLPEYDLTNHPGLDILIIPGGIVSNELKRPEIIEWIQQASQKTTITASVCTGAFLLAKAGLLDKKSATTHWEDINDLQAMFPEVQVVSNGRWVDNGHVVTSAGISAGIGMSLHLVDRLIDRKLAINTARKMEFDWNPDQH
jgi:transcriptional regulator GlxA family with amidase domain